jgi:putative tryptophan/tyrosine transport system substrate-binding protein
MLLRFALALLVLIAPPLVVEARQQTGSPRTPRIGVIWLGGLPSPPPSPKSPVVQFRESLRQLGYVEGQSISIESRFAGDGTGLAQVVADLIHVKVDAIVAMSTAAAWAAKNSTTAVPVVFAVAGDPVQFGLVNSLARPGGNLTGLYNLTAEHSRQRLSRKGTL